MPIERTELLPVTQADRDLVFELMHSACATEIERQALRYIKEGRGDDAEAVQRVAHHRISHSLPGDAVTPIERTAEQERAAIVAWLREKWGMLPEALDFADAIERGDHHSGETNNG